MNDQSNLPAMTPEKAGEIMEAVIAKGDLAQLNPTERAKYYTRVCTSMGLNPLTQPLSYITLNGKLTLYALKNCTDQLRKIYGVSVVEMTEAREGDLAIVTVKVQDRDGRTDMSKGALSLGNLKGEALANAIMKCETKAKRRATLSICGLGFLDETEVETIPGAKPEPRLLKKDHRAEYHQMLAELDHTLDVEEWANANGSRIAALPPDWQKNIGVVIDTKSADPTVSIGEIIADGWADQQGRSLHTATQSHQPEPPDAEPPEIDSAWEKMGPVKQAGTLCGDVEFAQFLAQAKKFYGTDGGAAEYVRAACGIKSRAELATDVSAQKIWRELVADYRAWQREPAIVDTSHVASPVRDATVQPPVAKTLPCAEATGGEAPPPTAADYTAMWDSVILGATPKQRTQIHKMWNEQRELRMAIAWNDEWPFAMLKDRVVAALEELKKP